MVEDKVKVFVYSEMQIDEENVVCKRIGKIFSCGTVTVGHTYTQYSKMINEEDLDAMAARYPDTKVIARGKLSDSNLKYTNVTREYVKETDVALEVQ